MVIELVTIGGYSINEYWWIFYWWLLMAIILVAIGGCSIIGY
jgi:hypothetical protein